MSRLSHPRGALALLILTGAVAFCLMLYAMKRGAGISPDSVSYIHAARQCAAGNGLLTLSPAGRFVPLIWFPPLYPLLLAVPAFFGIDPLVSAKFVSAFFFAASVMLTIAMALAATRALPAALLAGLLVLAAPAMIDVHRWTWSEPPFIAFSLAGLFLLSLHLHRQDRRFLVASALFIALAMLTRYVGMMLAPLALLLILLLSPAPLKRRLLDALLFALISGAPVAASLIRNARLAANATGRSVAYHPVPEKRLAAMVQTLSLWFLPPRFPERNTLLLILAAALALLLLALAARTLLYPRKTLEQIRASLAGYLLTTLLLFALLYIPALLTSITFIDRATPLSNRTLSPILPFLLILLVSAGTFLFRRWPTLSPPGLASRSALILLAAALLLHASGQSLAKVRQTRQGTDMGFVAPQWRNSKTIAWIKALPSDTPLYTNAPDALSILAARPARAIPRPEELAQPNGPTLRLLRQDLAQRRGYVVYFKALLGRQRHAPPAQLQQQLQLHPLTPPFKDAQVYFLPPPAP